MASVLKLVRDFSGPFLLNPVDVFSLRQWQIRRRKTKISRVGVCGARVLNVLDFRVVYIDSIVMVKRQADFFNS